jgi:hypothetical protein
MVQWTDERLGDRFAELDRRVTSVEPTVRDVIELRAEMRSLGDAVRRNTTAQETTATQLEGLTLEPLVRGRDFRTQLFLVIVSGLIGGGLAILAVLAGHG